MQVKKNKKYLICITFVEDRKCAIRRMKKDVIKIAFVINGQRLKFYIDIFAKFYRRRQSFSDNYLNAI